MNWFMGGGGGEIWLHEYLINPINSYEPGQFTLISMGLIRYSWSHISGSHEPIPTKFGLWMFFIILHRYMVSKTLKCKKSFLWRHRLCTLYPARLLWLAIRNMVPTYCTCTYTEVTALLLWSISTITCMGYFKVTVGLLQFKAAALLLNTFVSKALWYMTLKKLDCSLIWNLYRMFQRIHSSNCANFMKK